MEKSHENRIDWKRFIIFTLILGLVVAYLSVVSDNLPYLGDGVTVIEFFISYLAVMINSLPMWFIYAMLIGYLFAKDIKGAALLGTIYTLTAISFYFVISNFYTDVSIQLSFKEMVIVFVSWYGASTVGGIFGGIVGFLLKKTPYALLILLSGLILQLFVNGTRSWGHMVGIAQNVTFILMILSIFVYLTLVKKLKKKKINCGHSVI
ncbi:hypothetical protein BWGOE3_09240 [Bacillus mycoides]|uniref:hypothetical protein n=1 Tax=Bacillus mycoides TaxID=1405 RepID=UPI0008730DF0|nr:hypothetical protein [Bacillus mycoides]OFD51779.1 hypothetical protein BWGOE3_09240 [Bacillus mycoides]